MRHFHHRPGRYCLPCSLCGQEIVRGEDYWIMNGCVVCWRCLADFARAELSPYRRTRGKEESL